MSMTDPIADFLARIKNGIRARKQQIECPRSNLKLRLAEILRDEGFLQTVTSVDDDKQGMITVELKYDAENTGYGFRSEVVWDSYISSQPTSCQMKRPAAA